MNIRHLSELILLAALSPGLARGEGADEYLQQARQAWVQKKPNEALELAGKAIAADPRNARGYYFRGTLNEALQRHAEAVADCSRRLERDPQLAEAYNLRGSEQFKLGRIKESLADFDEFLKLRPQEAPGHWKRGISLYYAGRFNEGRQQFVGYEKVDTNDVENAVWHFLCNARLVGLDKARAKILKIGKDRRTPMMEVYDLYRGSLQPADVQAAAEAGEVSAAERKQRLFYAHLYLGLYYDVTGDKKQALDHLILAAEKYRIGHYMGDVAQVHADLLRKELRK
jgi:lipoprotein NlpI